MKKIAFTLFATLLLCSCSSITPEQREKVVDLVINGVQIAEAIYLADTQTKDKDFELVNTYANGDIIYQSALCVKLLKQDAKQGVFEKTGQTYETTLRYFLTKMAELKAAGHETTPLRIKEAKVKDGVVVSLMYALQQPDGSYIDEECPSCVIWDD